MEILSDYMRDPDKRRALNDLTRATFGFDFEGWVAGGYYEGDYVPYSLMEGGRMLSNVSASRMDFAVGADRVRYIQLGTVMTDEALRGRGYGRRLMEHVIDRYAGQCDGIYLFANLDALGFYEKLGFSCLPQYRPFAFHLPPRQGQPFSPAGPDNLPRYRRAVRDAAPNARMDQVNRFALHMFHTANMEGVLYCPQLDAWAVLEEDGGAWRLSSLICSRRLSLEEVLPRLPGEIDRLELGFTPWPEDEALCDFEPYDGGDDYRLMSLGDGLKRVEAQGLYFPVLSHT